MPTIQRNIVTLMLTFLVLTLTACAGSDTRSSTGEYIDDTVVTTRVKAAIIADETLRSSEINVETFRGVVQLSGFVSSQAQIDTAVRVTQAVDGVESVRNDMRLR